MIKLIGIDISHWQKGFNLADAKTAGYDFVICKAGGHEGTVYYKDECFKKFVVQALSIGMKVGAYFYSTAKSVHEAVKEANFFNNILSDFKQSFEFPVFIDYEDSECLKDTKCCDYVNAFVETIEKAGYTAGVYASAFVHKNQLYRYKYGNRWIAHWNIGKQNMYANEGIHQYTNRAVINGFLIDANFTNVDYPEIIRLNNKNGFLNCDSNNDGKINSKDIVHTMKHVANNKGYDEKLDVNKDGTVNSKDITKIMKEVSKNEAQ